jgi:plastocyanin
VDQAEFQTWLQDKIEGAPPASPSAPPSGEPPPSGQPPPSGEPPPSGAVTISAANASSFEQSAVQVPAGVAFTLTFDNKDVLPHNVAIRDASGAELFQGEIFTGPAKRDYQVPALPAGSYTFVCSVHPNMTGTLTAN